MFKGFAEEAFEFYDGLEADNSRVYWHDHKTVYEDAVKAPIVALTAEFPQYGDFHVFRPNRDVRFSANKLPYKTAQGAVAGDGAAGTYVQISAGGLMAARGYYMMTPDQLARFRAAVADDTSGPEVAAIVDALRKDHYDVGARDAVKSAPRGYSADHPRIELPGSTATSGTARSRHRLAAVAPAGAERRRPRPRAGATSTTAPSPGSRGP